MKKLNIDVVQGGKALGLASAVVTISDIAQPIAPVAAYVLAASVISLVIIFLAKLIKTNLGAEWTTATYFSAMIFVVSSTLYFQTADNDEAKKKGLIASNVTAISSLQQDLGLINESLSSIDESTKVIAINSTKTVDKLSELVKSSDPRKELKNIGVSWTVDNFGEAVLKGDLRVIELFLEAGMNPNLELSNGDKASSNVIKSEQNTVEIFKLLDKYEYDLRAISPNGKDSFLRLAIENQDRESAEYLIDYGLSKSAIKADYQNRIQQRERSISDAEVSREKCNNQRAQIRAKWDKKIKEHEKYNDDVITAMLKSQRGMDLMDNGCNSGPIDMMIKAENSILNRLNAHLKFLTTLS